MHKTVNHSKEFKDPVDGTCTNLIENQWKCCKQKFKVKISIVFENVLFQLMEGTTYNMIPSYIDEYLWRQRNSKKSKEVFLNMLKQIGELWPF